MNNSNLTWENHPKLPHLRATSLSLVRCDDSVGLGMRALVTIRKGPAENSKCVHGFVVGRFWADMTAVPGVPAVRVTVLTLVAMTPPATGLHMRSPIKVFMVVLVPRDPSNPASGLSWRYLDPETFFQIVPASELESLRTLIATETKAVGPLRMFENSIVTVTPGVGDDVDVFLMTRPLCLLREVVPETMHSRGPSGPGRKPRAQPAAPVDFTDVAPLPAPMHQEPPVVYLPNSPPPLVPDSPLPVPPASQALPNPQQTPPPAVSQRESSSGSRRESPAVSRGSSPAGQRTPSPERPREQSPEPHKPSPPPPHGPAAPAPPAADPLLPSPGSIMEDSQFEEPVFLQTKMAQPPSPNSSGANPPPAQSPSMLSLSQKRSRSPSPPPAWAFPSWSGKVADIKTQHLQSGVKRALASAGGPLRRNQAPRQPRHSGALSVSAALPHGARKQGSVVPSGPPPAVQAPSLDGCCLHRYFESVRHSVCHHPADPADDLLNQVALHIKTKPLVSDPHLQRLLQKFLATRHM